MAIRVVLVSQRREVISDWLAIAGESRDFDLLEVVDAMDVLAATLVGTPNIEIVVVDSALDDGAATVIVRTLARQFPVVVPMVIVDSSNELRWALDTGARGAFVNPVALADVERRISDAHIWRESLELGGGIGQGSDRGRIVAVAGVKGGVGVSTFAVTLAIEATALGRSVCLVDMDLRSGDLAFLCGASPHRSIADLTSVVGDLNVQGIREVAVDVPSGFMLLSAPEYVEQAEDMSAQVVQSVLRELSSHFGVVIVDIGRYLDDNTACVLDLSDQVLLLLEGDLVSLRAARRTLDAWDRLNVRRLEEIGLVVMKNHRGQEIQADAVQRWLLRPVAAIVKECGKDLEEPVNTGQLTARRIPQLGDPAVELFAKMGITPPDLHENPNTRGKAKKRSASGVANPKPRATNPKPRTAKPPRGRKKQREAGGFAVELPIFIAVVLMAFFIGVQTVVLGAGHVLANHALNDAAREAAIDARSSKIAKVADTAMLGFSFKESVVVSTVEKKVRVKVTVPKLFGWMPAGLDVVEVETYYTPEPK